MTGKFFINFCSNQICKTFNVVPLSLTCPSRINLTQTNKFTVKSVKGVFHSFYSLIAFRFNCCLQNFCNSTCWQLNCSAVTLTRLFKKKKKLNATSQVWELIKLRLRGTNGLCVVFFEEGKQRSEIRHSSCPVLFILLKNRTKLNVYACVSMRLERWTNVFVTSFIWCNRCTYDLFYCKVANV